MTVLDGIETRHGTLHHYHRLIAVHDPALLEAYDAFYAQLTAADRHLSAPAKEIVWIALLASLRQGRGRLHIARARALGVDEETIAEAAALAALPQGADPAWLAPEIDPALAFLASAAACAARLDMRGLRAALEAAAELGVTIGQAVEALSLIMVPSGLAAYFEAAEDWSAKPAGGALLLEQTAPDLLGAVKRFHDRLLIHKRALPATERAFVLGALAAMGVRTDLDLGPAPPADDRAAALTAVMQAWPALEFITGRWSVSLPGFDAASRYTKLVEQAAPGVPPRTLHLAGLLVHAYQREMTPFRLHLLAAFETGATVVQVAEAITYLRLSGTGMAFIGAIETWADSARSGLCPAPFATSAAG